jgi:2-iminobutanoate/2-iminopropanoate deaminase
LTQKIRPQLDAAMPPAQNLGTMELVNNTPNVPAAVGPYSQAVRCGGLLFCSGQIPINPATGKIEAADVEGQARQVLGNIKALLTAQNLDMNHVVKATVFLTSMADFPKVNPIYDEAFQGHKPARSTVAVAGLPLGALIEIEVIAELQA